MRIALVQMRCEKTAVGENLSQMERYLREAEGQNADIVCFPEASITGYVNEMEHPGSAVDLDGPEILLFLALTRKSSSTALAGVVERNPDGLPFVTQVVAQRGAMVGYYRKINHGDEAHLYSPGAEVPIFAHPKGPFGIAICADIDAPHVLEEASRKGARVVFVAAAPGLHGLQETRNWRTGYEWWRGECRTKLGRYARDYGLHIAVATQAGRTRDEDFPGGGYVFRLDGRLLAGTPDWSEGILYADLLLST